MVARRALLLMPTSSHQQESISMPPRKAAPAKKTTAAVSARREVRAEKNRPKPLEVKFRGAVFVIDRDRLGSHRVFLRLEALRHFGNAENAAKLLFEILGSHDSGRFIDLCGDGDDIATAGAEFYKALNKAGNVPNS